MVSNHSRLLLRKCIGGHRSLSAIARKNARAIGEWRKIGLLGPICRQSTIDNRQCSDQIKNCMSATNGTVWYGSPSAMWQPVDAGYGQLLQT